MRPLATLAAPSGIMTALDKRAAERGEARAALLSRAGITQADWDAISAALAGVNAANLRRLLNASHAVILVAETPCVISPGPDGKASPNSFNAPVTSAFGDLS